MAQPELVIDSSCAVAGANDYARAIEAARLAMERSLRVMSGDDVSALKKKKKD